MNEVKNILIKRDDRDGWIYICPHCFRRIVISHKMKKCYYCNEPIDVDVAKQYSGPVKKK